MAEQARPAPLPAHERFDVQHPTVIQAPLPAVAELDRVPCGHCEHFHRSGRSAFGQCLKAQRSLASPLYRGDLDSCSMGSVSKL